MYLRLESIPELQRAPRDVRRRIVQQALRNLHLNASDGLKLALPIGLLIFLTMASPSIVSHHLGNFDRTTLIFFALAFLLGMLWFYTVLLRVLRPRVAEYFNNLLIDNRLKQCLMCDYNLNGSTSDTCPECGAEVTTNREPHG